MVHRNRILLGVVFVVSLTICGLVAGAWIGGNFFVPKGSGLAGPAIALGYGLIGALLAAIVGSLLAVYLPPKRLIVIALPIGVVGVAILSLVAIFVKRSRLESGAHLEQAYERLNAFELALTYEAGVDDPPFRRMELDGKARNYRTLTADDRSCTAALSGAERVAILTALRDVEGLLLRDAFPCAGTPGAVQRRMEFRIVEARPPDSEGKLTITDACLKAHAALEAPFTVAAGILRAGDHPRECR